MVVWQGGEMKKDDYKRYKIRTVTGTDDFAADAGGAHAPLLARRSRARGRCPTSSSSTAAAASSMPA